MKKVFILIALTGLSHLLVAQSCDKKSCGPEGTKTEEARVISSMRADLQSVIEKMASANKGFDSELTGYEISKGDNDDESLLLIYQTAITIRSEFVGKLEATQLVKELKKNSPAPAGTKQELVAGLKKQIDLLTEQANKL